MAIFQKAYRGYEGPLTQSYERILVIFRYGMAEVFGSRLFAAFFGVSFLLPLALIFGIYVYYNLDLLLQFEVDINDLIDIEGTFFAVMMQYPQLFLIFVLVMVLGPTMIAPDIRNNAMPLYLSRPISKSSYIIGKLLVLIVLGSLISWVPAMFIVAAHVWVGPDGWLMDNLHIPFAAIVSSLAWILCLSLLAFAISTFVKWKAVARMVFFGLIFFSSVLGQVIQEIFGGWGGQSINLSAAIYTMVLELYQTNEAQLDVTAAMPLSAAFASLLVVSAAALLVLYQRIRAFQVVS